MTLESNNVRVGGGAGVTGEVFVGPTTATPPATAAAATTGYTGLGYISENGIERTPERKTKDIVAWQNGAVVKTVVDGAAKVTLKFTLIETNKDSIEFAFGTTVTQTATEGTYSADPGATGGRKSFVFDTIEGANLRRETFEGELTTLGATKFAAGEPIAYECEVTAYTVPQVHDTALKTP